MRYLRLWQVPRDYIGAHWDGYWVFMGRNRDSDALVRSNFEIALKRLESLPEFPGSGDEGSRFVVSENHWAVGWVEWIAIHGEDAAGLDAAREMARSLEDYPVLDEDHFSELEWSEAADYWAGMRVTDRVDAIHKSGSRVSVFAARRPEIPHDDNGALLDYLRA